MEWDKNPFFDNEPGYVVFQSSLPVKVGDIIEFRINNVLYLLKVVRIEKHEVRCRRIDASWAWTAPHAGLYSINFNADGMIAQWLGPETPDPNSPPASE